MSSNDEIVRIINVVSNSLRGFAAPTVVDGR